MRSSGIDDSKRGWRYHQVFEVWTVPGAQTDHIRSYLGSSLKFLCLSAAAAAAAAAAARHAMTQAKLVADAEQRRLVLHALLREEEEKLHQMQQEQHDSEQNVKRPRQQASEAAPSGSACPAAGGGGEAACEAAAEEAYDGILRSADPEKCTIQEYMRYIGFDWETDKDFVWIVQSFRHDDFPPNIREYVQNGLVFWGDEMTQESTWKHPSYDKYTQMLHAARMNPEHWGGVGRAGTQQAAASDVPAPKRRPQKLQPLQPSAPSPKRLLQAVASEKPENLQKLQPPPIGRNRRQ